MILQKNKYKLYSLFCAGVLLLSFGKIQAQTPGGIDMSGNGYTLDLWVDGDHSTNTSWNNIVPAQ